MLRAAGTRALACCSRVPCARAADTSAYRERLRALQSRYGTRDAADAASPASENTGIAPGSTADPPLRPVPDSVRSQLVPRRCVAACERLAYGADAPAQAMLATPAVSVPATDASVQALKERLARIKQQASGRA